MKYFSKIFILMSLFILSALGAPSEIMSAEPNGLSERRPCVINATYFDGCNYCTCGRFNYIGCTLIGCNQYDPKSPGYTPKLEPPADFWVDAEYVKPTRKCVVGASYFDGCNTCSCTPGSVPICTRPATELCALHKLVSPPTSFWQK